MGAAVGCTLFFGFVAVAAGLWESFTYHRQRRVKA